MKNFHEKKLKEIKLWAWAAAVLPLSTLSALFLAHFIGLETLYHQLLVVGGVILFTLSVVWWWWALYTIGSVTQILGNTLKKFYDVNKELDKIKKDIKDL